jgi:hypothetical protein
MWKLAPEEGNRDVARLIPLFLERLVEPRVCIFTLLMDSLRQPFSLDNGLALQETTLLWLRMTPSGRKSGPELPMLALKRTKQFHTVWWEARCVKVWTWPMELKDSLVELCHTLLETLSGNATECSKHGFEKMTFQVRPVFNQTSDICHDCTHLMFDQLRLDYKCINLSSM